jgi:hypothetical protein
MFAEFEATEMVKSNGAVKREMNSVNTASEIEQEDKNTNECRTSRVEEGVSIDYGIYTPMGCLHTTCSTNSIHKTDDGERSKVEQAEVTKNTQDAHELGTVAGSIERHLDPYGWEYGFSRAGRPGSCADTGAPWMLPLHSVDNMGHMRNGGLVVGDEMNEGPQNVERNDGEMKEREGWCCGCVVI